MRKQNENIKFKSLNNEPSLPFLVERQKKNQNVSVVNLGKKELSSPAPWNYMNYSIIVKNRQYTINNLVVNS